MKTPLQMFLTWTMFISLLVVANGCTKKKVVKEASAKESSPVTTTGQQGKAGTNGKDGLTGKGGKDGQAGKNGIDGKNGENGKDGTNGINGTNGANGKDGQSCTVTKTANSIVIDCGASKEEVPLNNCLVDENSDPDFIIVSGCMNVRIPKGNSNPPPQPTPSPDPDPTPTPEPVPPPQPCDNCPPPTPSPSPSEDTVESKELIDFLFNPPNDLNLEARTDAIVVWRNGSVILEKYARGYSAEKKHYLWSVSKSISGTLIGAAVQQKKLSLDDKVSQFLPLKEDLANTTVKNVIEWSTGLDWQESYEGSGDQTKSSVGQLLYNKGVHDVVAYVTKHPLTAAPGEKFAYSTGDSTLLVSILNAIYKDDKYFPWTLLFDKLGIQAVFETDQKNQFLGGSGCYMTARDLLKVGELYLRKGEWNGEQILSEEFVNFAFGQNEVFANSDRSSESQFPGRHWWLNLNPQNPEQARYALPKDTVFALGHWGQTLTIIPSQNTLVVRFAHDLKRDGQGRNFKEEYFQKLANFLGSLK